MVRFPKPIAVALVAIVGAAALAIACSARGAAAAGPDRLADGAAECASPKPAWLWCDDFEADRRTRYFEVDDAQGAFTRVAGVGVAGSSGMRGRFTPGIPGAGSLKVAFGKTPGPRFRPVDGGTAQYREIYWRLYVRNDSGWTGGGADKLSRATSLVSAGWAQSMVAHVWSGSGAHSAVLVADPASGTDAGGTLRTTRYNDLANFRWLGAVRGTTPIFAAPALGAWHCVEAHVTLNAAGQSDGLFELWVDGRLEARKTALNWVGTYSQYGINAVFFENYWNDGSPVAQSRYFDDIVVSTERIGCHA